MYILKRFLFFLLAIFAFVTLSTACQMRGADNSKPSPKILPTPAPVPANIVPKVEDFSPTYVNNVLKSGGTVPLFVMAYADPGNTDLSLIREVVHQADANSIVDKDVGRERDFTDYPYTVDSYFILVKTPEAFASIQECATRFPRVKLIVFPLFKLKLKSYLKVTYSKPLFKDAVVKTFWIGDSNAIEIPDDPATLNLEDPLTYVPILRACEELGHQCFNDLLKNGYFARKTLIDEKLSSPLQFLDKELTASQTLLDKGFDGEVSMPGSMLNLTYDQTIIRNLTLVHELWASGPQVTDDPTDVLLRVQGFEHHPVVLQNKVIGRSFYMLPVNVNESSIPLRIRNTPSRLSGLYQQFKMQISNAVDDNL
jgi:hypothetical protein